VGLVDPDDPLGQMPEAPTLLPPGVVIVPPSSGFIGVPPGEAGYEIVDPITGRVVSVPRGGALLVHIPPGGRGYRVIEGISRREIKIPIGGSSWIVDPTNGRVLGIPSRISGSGSGGKYGLVDKDGSPRPQIPGVLPPGIIVQPPAGGFIGVPMKGSGYKIIDPITGRVLSNVPEQDAILILIPPGGGGYRLIDPITHREVQVPSGGGYYVVDSTTAKVIGIPGSGDGKEGLVDPDDLVELPHVGEMIMIPGRLPWLPGTRFRPVLPCDCDAVGSIGISCSDSGQCLCKPGVEGLKCRKCAKAFYDFSAEGCRPCNCDPVGSLSSSCDERGRCVCLENVVGDKCSQCKRNMFGLNSSSRQCFPCDVCYDLIDERVERHQASMDRLKTIFYSGGDRRKELSNVTNEEMDKLIDDVNATVTNFLARAKTVSSSPAHQRFVVFATDLSSLTASLASIRNERTVMLRSAELSARESRLLQDLNKEIDSLVSSLDDRLDALKDLLMDANSLDNDSDLTKSLKALNLRGEEASKLADSHSNTARTISDTAKTASSMTRDSRFRLEESLRRVESVGEDLARLRKEAQRTKNQVETMVANAQRNREKAVKALAEARQTAKEVKGHQPGVSDVVSEKIAETMKNAKNIERVSTDLRNANKKILGQVKVAEEKGSKIFQEALTQQQILDKLVEDAYSVNRTAETAKNLTKGILGEAQRTLETLSDFDNTVTSSKLETKAAISRISDIEQLLDRVDATIRDTNVKWKRSFVRKTVDKALNQSKEAERLSSLLSINASSLRTETSTTLKVAEEVKVRSEKLISVEFQATETQLSDMETTSDDDIQKSEESVTTTSTTRQSWRRTDIKADDVLWRLEAILDDLSRLGNPSTSNLESLGKELDAAELLVSSMGLDEKIARYEIGARQQGEVIKSAEEDYSSLENEVINVEDIHKALPLPERKNCPQLLELEASRKR